MTPKCTIQACQIRDSKRDFSLYETVVLGISPDPPERLVEFAAKKNLDFDLLSDKNYEVVQKYAVWKYKTFMGIGFSKVLRRVFIIGKDGRIKHIILQGQGQDLSSPHFRLHQKKSRRK